MMKSMSGTTAAIGAWLFALSSTEPPIVTEYPAGSPFTKLGHLRRELIHDCLRLRGVEDACLERDRGSPRSAPDCRLLDFVAQRGDRPERHRLAAEAGQLQVAQRVDRCALRCGRASHHVHQVNAIAHLGDRGAGRTPFNVVAMSSELTPSWRALSCRTSTLTTRAGSIQSNTT